MVWVVGVSDSSDEHPLDLSVSEHALTCSVQQGLSKLHSLVHLRKGATENRDEARLPSHLYHYKERVLSHARQRSKYGKNL